METPSKVTTRSNAAPANVTIVVVTPESGAIECHNFGDDDDSKATTRKLLRRALFGKPNNAQKGSIPLQGVHLESDITKFIKSKVPLQSNVKKVYSIVSAKTGNIGGNGHGGAIYGETTAVSLQKMIELMKIHTEFDSKSRFIDVGSGLGKPNLHVAQDPGVELSYGIEMEKVRWMLGMNNLHHVLKEAELQFESEGSEPPTEQLIGHNCFFAHGDITQATTFDPFTHVYMFDIGFPPNLLMKLSEMFNKSCSPYLICYHAPRLIVDRYKFQVELLCQQSTSMHGSKEIHTGYIYRRKNFKKVKNSKNHNKCDPLFKESWGHVQKGLHHISSVVEERLSSALESGRAKRPRTLIKNDCLL